jgi:hypothetical protein
MATPDQIQTPRNPDAYVVRVPRLQSNFDLLNNWYSQIPANDPNGDLVDMFLDEFADRQIRIPGFTALAAGIDQVSKDTLRRILDWLLNNDINAVVEAYSPNNADRELVRRGLARVLHVLSQAGVHQALQLADGGSVEQLPNVQNVENPMLVEREEVQDLINLYIHARQYYRDDRYWEHFRRLPRNLARPATLEQQEKYNLRRFIQYLLNKLDALSIEEFTTLTHTTNGQLNSVTNVVAALINNPDQAELTRLDARIPTDQFQIVLAEVVAAHFVVNTIFPKFVREGHPQWQVANQVGATLTVYGEDLVLDTDHQAEIAQKFVGESTGATNLKKYFTLLKDAHVDARASAGAEEPLLWLSLHPDFKPKSIDDLLAPNGPVQNYLQAKNYILAVKKNPAAFGLGDQVSLISEIEFQLDQAIAVLVIRIVEEQNLLKGKPNTARRGILLRKRTTYSFGEEVQNQLQAAWEGAIGTPDQPIAQRLSFIYDWNLATADNVDNLAAFVQLLGQLELPPEIVAVFKLTSPAVRVEITKQEQQAKQKARHLLRATERLFTTPANGLSAWDELAQQIAVFEQKRENMFGSLTNVQALFDAQQALQRTLAIELAPGITFKNFLASLEEFRLVFETDTVLDIDVVELLAPLRKRWQELGITADTIKERLDLVKRYENEGLEYVAGIADNIRPGFAGLTVIANQSQLPTVLSAIPADERGMVMSQYQNAFDDELNKLLAELASYPDSTQPRPADPTQRQPGIGQEVIANAPMSVKFLIYLYSLGEIGPKPLTVEYILGAIQTHFAPVLELLYNAGAAADQQITPADLLYIILPEVTAINGTDTAQLSAPLVALCRELGNVNVTYNALHAPATKLPLRPVALAKPQARVVLTPRPTAQLNLVNDYLNTVASAQRLQVLYGGVNQDNFAQYLEGILPANERAQLILDPAQRVKFLKQWRERVMQARLQRPAALLTLSDDYQTNTQYDLLDEHTRNLEDALIFLVFEDITEQLPVGTRLPDLNRQNWRNVDSAARLAFIRSLAQLIDQAELPNAQAYRQVLVMHPAFQGYVRSLMGAEVDAVEDMRRQLNQFTYLHPALINPAPLAQRFNAINAALQNSDIQQNFGALQVHLGSLRQQVGQYLPGQEPDFEAQLNAILEQLEANAEIADFEPFQQEGVAQNPWIDAERNILRNSNSEAATAKLRIEQLRINFSQLQEAYLSAVNGAQAHLQELMPVEMAQSAWNRLWQDVWGEPVTDQSLEFADVVIFNNNPGDVLTEENRIVYQAVLEGLQRLRANNPLQIPLDQIEWKIRLLQRGVQQRLSLAIAQTIPQIQVTGYPQARFVHFTNLLFNTIDGTAADADLYRQLVDEAGNPVQLTDLSEYLQVLGQQLAPTDKQFIVLAYPALGTFINRILRQDVEQQAAGAAQKTQEIIIVNSTVTTAIRELQALKTRLQQADNAQKLTIKSEIELILRGLRNLAQSVNQHAGFFYFINHQLENLEVDIDQIRIGELSVRDIVNNVQALTEWLPQVDIVGLDSVRRLSPAYIENRLQIVRAEFEQVLILVNELNGEMPRGNKVADADFFAYPKERRAGLAGMVGLKQRQSVQTPKVDLLANTNRTNLNIENTQPQNLTEATAMGVANRIASLNFANPDAQQQLIQVLNEAHINVPVPILLSQPRVVAQLVQAFDRLTPNWATATLDQVQAAQQALANFQQTLRVIQHDLPPEVAATLAQEVTDRLDDVIVVMPLLGIVQPTNGGFANAAIAAQTIGNMLNNFGQQRVAGALALLNIHQHPAAPSIGPAFELAVIGNVELLPQVFDLTNGILNEAIVTDATDEPGIERLINQLAQLIDRQLPRYFTQVQAAPQIVTREFATGAMHWFTNLGNGRAIIEQLLAAQDIAGLNNLRLTFNSIQLDTYIVNVMANYVVRAFNLGPQRYVGTTILGRLTTVINALPNLRYQLGANVINITTAQELVDNTVLAAHKSPNGVNNQNGAQPTPVAQPVQPQQVTAANGANLIPAGAITAQLNQLMANVRSGTVGAAKILENFFSARLNHAEAVELAQAVVNTPNIVTVLTQMIQDRTPTDDRPGLRALATLQSRVDNPQLDQLILDAVFAVLNPVIDANTADTDLVAGITRHLRGLNVLNQGNGDRVENLIAYVRQRQADNLAAAPQPAIPTPQAVSQPQQVSLQDQLASANTDGQIVQTLLTAPTPEVTNWLMEANHVELVQRLIQTDAGVEILRDLITAHPATQQVVIDVLADNFDNGNLDRFRLGAILQDLHSLRYQLNGVAGEITDVYDLYDYIEARKSGNNGSSNSPVNPPSPIMPTTPATPAPGANGGPSIPPTPPVPVTVGTVNQINNQPGFGQIFIQSPAEAAAALQQLASRLNTYTDEQLIELATEITSETNRPVLIEMIGSDAGLIALQTIKDAYGDLNDEYALLVHAIAEAVVERFTTQINTNPADQNLLNQLQNIAQRLNGLVFADANVRMRNAQEIVNHIQSRVVTQPVAAAAQPQQVGATPAVDPSAITPTSARTQIMPDAAVVQPQISNADAAVQTEELDFTTALTRLEDMVTEVTDDTSTTEVIQQFRDPETLAPLITAIFRGNFNNGMNALARIRGLLEGAHVRYPIDEGNFVELIKVFEDAVISTLGVITLEESASGQAGALYQNRLDKLVQLGVLSPERQENLSDEALNVIKLFVNSVNNQQNIDFTGLSSALRDLEPGAIREVREWLLNYIDIQRIVDNLLIYSNGGGVLNPRGMQILNMLRTAGGDTYMDPLILNTLNGFFSAMPDKTRNKSANMIINLAKDGYWEYEFSEIPQWLPNLTTIGGEVLDTPQKLFEYAKTVAVSQS